MMYQGMEIDRTMTAAFLKKVRLAASGGSTEPSSEFGGLSERQSASMFLSTASYDDVLQFTWDMFASEEDREALGSWQVADRSIDCGEFSRA